MTVLISNDRPLFWATALAGCLAACGASDPPGGNPPADAGVVTADAGVLEPDAGTVDSGVRPRHPEPIWQAGPDTPEALGRWGARMTFVPPEARFVIFGGNRWPDGASLADTWSFDPAADEWSVIDTTGDTPAGRYCHCTTYLPPTHEVLIVGGRGDRGALPPGAWTLDLSTSVWTAVAVNVPPGVIGCTAEWMPEVMGGRAMVFSGGSNTGLDRRTYLYDPSARTFTTLTTTVAPPGRADPAHTYDPIGKRVLVFGGGVRVVAPYEHLADLWAFDGERWTELNAPNGPAPRRFPGAAYDPIAHEWHVVTGTNDQVTFDDHWTLDLNTLGWRQLSLPDRPRARGFVATGYDPVGDALYFFGGLDQDYRARTDGWRLEF